MLVTVDRIKRFSSASRQEYSDCIVEKWETAEEAGLTSPLRVQHFFAQIAAETGGIKRLDENLNYSRERLLTIFGNRVTPAEATQLANKPEAIANHVYANKNGNGNKASGDGWRYRGSGFIQLTGRGNFRDRGAEIDMDLEGNPELARTPEPGFSAALAYWKARNINTAADGGISEATQKSVRRLVNGGLNGFEDAKIWFARARNIFTAEESIRETGDEAELEAVAQLLQSLGYGPALESSGPTNPEILGQAIRRLQADAGLAQTGIYDDAVLEALTDRPRPSVMEEDGPR